MNIIVRGPAKFVLLFLKVSGHICHCQESFYVYSSKYECNVGLPIHNSAQHGYWEKHYYSAPPPFMYKMRLFLTILSMKRLYLRKTIALSIYICLSRWMNNDILENIRKRDMLLHQFKKDNNSGIYEQFCRTRNQIQRDIKKAKASYFSDKVEANKNNPKGLWKQFRSLGYSSKGKDQSQF